MGERMVPANKEGEEQPFKFAIQDNHTDSHTFCLTHACFVIDATHPLKAYSSDFGGQASNTTALTLQRIAL
jgi:hypothetical protein